MQILDPLVRFRVPPPACGAVRRIRTALFYKLFGVIDDKHIIMASEASIHEKRAHPRRRCDKLVHIKFIDTDGLISSQVMGHVQNISKGGAKILSPLQARSGRIIMMSTLDADNRSFGIRGEIVYCSKSESGGYLLGVRFAAPESSRIKFIRAVVQTYFFQRHQAVANS